MNKNATLYVSLFTLLIAFLPVNGMALQSLGDVAENLMGPTSIVTKLIDITCYVIGFAFVLVSFAQYKIHRQNPKLVPLTTPVLLLVLGLCALLVPYVTQVTGTGKSTTAKEAKEEKPNLLPLPDLQKESGIPYPPGSGQSGSQNGAPPASAPPASSEPPPPPPSGGGHWTQDPRYN